MRNAVLPISKNVANTLINDAVAMFSDYRELVPKDMHFGLDLHVSTKDSLDSYYTTNSIDKTCEYDYCINVRLTLDGDGEGINLPLVYLDKDGNITRRFDYEEAIRHNVWGGGSDA